MPFQLALSGSFSSLSPLLFMPCHNHSCCPNFWGRGVTTIDLCSPYEQSLRAIELPYQLAGSQSSQKRVASDFILSNTHSESRARVCEKGFNMKANHESSRDLKERNVREWNQTQLLQKVNHYFQLWL